MSPSFEVMLWRSRYIICFANSNHLLSFFLRLGVATHPANPMATACKPVWMPSVLSVSLEKVDKTLFCLTFWPGEEFTLTLIFYGHLYVIPYAAAVNHWWDHYVVKIMSIPDLIITVLPQSSIIGNSAWSFRRGGNRRSKFHECLCHMVMQFTCAPRIPSSPMSYMLFHLDWWLLTHHYFITS